VAGLQIRTAIAARRAGLPPPAAAALAPAGMQESESGAQAPLKRKRASRASEPESAAPGGRNDCGLEDEDEAEWEQRVQKRLRTAFGQVS
jgi:hypothetical protein